MALIECPECGRQVSDKAPTCPNCGVPIASQPPYATAQPQESEQQPPQDHDVEGQDERQWTDAELEEMEFNDRVQRHRVMSVLLFFGGLTLGMGMKTWLGYDPDGGRPLVYYLADLMVWAGIIWLIYNEGRNLWYHRRLGG
ncbi:zinc ribbon domain-containing protein [Ectothiorhodospira mobilis]|uniref:zinc ribbon domain-containing protein n=1 Tax=Ectothiorhodospira mobilis TaxID=195064 RepID=UPI001EE7D9AA|nr:zinc ribbon domain-containing protein [Ectothiorhodospira mobilis]MCG5535734.1 zinc-ribbon domain-containing protein [Ectothiorhodospira mobilis]